MESLTQPWAIAVLASAVVSLLAVALLGQLYINWLRSARQDFLNKVEPLFLRQRDLLEQQLELTSALRAERMYVEQLKRKAQLLEKVIQDEAFRSGLEQTSATIDSCCKSI